MTIRPTRSVDPVVEAYKAHVDQTLFVRTLRLTPSQRIDQLQQFVAFLADARAAGRRAEEARAVRHTD